MNQPPLPMSLSDLRAEIDRIDEAMHRLLMERSEIIERLVKVKRTGGAEGGSAFRPAREADMMRRLVERHGGLLPLDTVESIWRVIIATFTYVQAPYAVHADISGGEPVMRDSARFHFGFTVPFTPHMGAEAAIAAVAASTGDLALLVAAPAAATVPWWRALEAPDAPKIIARLPFVERADHPAGLPVFVVAHPIRDAAVTDVCVHSLHVSGWSPRAARAIPSYAEAVVVADLAPREGAALLVSLPEGRAIAAVAEALQEAGAEVAAPVSVGSHAAVYRLDQTGA